MKLIDLNRDGGIGANSLYLEIGEFRILIDAGMHPKQVGRRAVPDYSLLRDIELDFVVLTHCHLDHLGSLPVLMREHPRTQVLMSQPSQALAERMLHNSCNVMSRQREELNLPEYPLYTHNEVEQIGKRFLPVIFGQPKRVHLDNDELEITLFPAGHVAGAAGVQIVHKHRAIFFTGDVLFHDQLTLPGAKFPRRDYDTVVLETTRGATERPAGQTRETEVARLLSTINNTIDRGGSCLIPVFALGRMQEILTILHAARRERKLVNCPVYGAGLGLDLADYFDEIARKTGLVKFNRSVIKELKLKPSPRKFSAGKDQKEKGIYILSSGMMVENTPSYNMAASLLPHHANSVCFVGYCDPDTPGGKLLETSPGEVFLFEALHYQTPIRASVERFELSGHADRDELLEFAIQANPRAIVLSHGDPPARAWFADRLAEDAPKIKVTDPTPLQSYLI